MNCTQTSTNIGKFAGFLLHFVMLHHKSAVLETSTHHTER